MKLIYIIVTIRTVLVNNMLHTAHKKFNGNKPNDFKSELTINNTIKN